MLGMALTTCLFGVHPQRPQNLQAVALTQHMLKAHPTPPHAEPPIGAKLPRGLSPWNLGRTLC